MSRWIKIPLIIAGSLIGLILLIFVAASIYITTNKKAVLDKIMVQLNKNIHGKLSVEGIEPSLLKGFPGVSVSLKNVLLRDSLWINHRHDLLKANDLDVTVNAWSLIFGNLQVDKIAVNDALIYIYTDTTGYSNTAVFKKKSQSATNVKSKGTTEFGRFAFNKVHLVIDNRQKYKLLDFTLNNVDANLDYPDSGWAGTAKLDMFVNNFEFNTRRGSFLKQKTISGKLKISLNKKQKIIIVDPAKLNIGGDEFDVAAKVDFTEKPSGFTLDVGASNILYKNAWALLPPNISSKLAKFDIEKPMAVNARIIGLPGKREPIIDVSCSVKNNILKTVGSVFTDCSFEGFYTNQKDKNIETSDENSIIQFRKFSSKFYNAPFKVDTLNIINLKDPSARGVFTAEFPLSDLNKSVGGDTFDFKNGVANLRLNYAAKIDSFKLVKPVVTGYIKIRDADILYVPRKLHMVNSSLNLSFTENDLSLSGARFQVGKSILYVDGGVRNFWNFYYSAPEKIILNWKLRSPQLYLNEFVPFLGPRNKKKKRRSSNLIDQLGNVLDESKVNMSLKVDKAIYGNFTARNLTADINLAEDGMHLRNMAVAHAGGQLRLNGDVVPGSSTNSFKINAIVSHVNVKEFFHSFNNFGQNTITSKNLTGYLSARIKAAGKISDAGKILPRSLNGQAIFNLQKASLINFEPIQKVGKFIFANRDFNNIQIETLDGTFDINDDKIEIRPMKVNSSVLNFDVKGTYGLAPGKTDVEVDVPVRNPKKDEDITSKKQRKERRMRGLVLHLKATDEEGKMKVKWNKDHD